jgi:predicted  nucleic acid-binding Zn-ribbon protein
VNAPLEALLTLQHEDTAIRAIESRAAALAPRLGQLEQARQAALKALDGARGAVAREEERYATLATRVADFRRLTERAVAHGEQAAARQAAAATAQYDIARKALTEAEQELNGSAARLVALKGAVTAAEQRLAALEAEQAPARAEVEAQRGILVREMQAARAKRADAARAVDAPTLSRYDRVSARRRGPAVYAIRATARGFSCGSCDTTVATQRRPQFVAGAIEVCEGCGVLLYYAKPAEEHATA